MNNLSVMQAGDSVVVRLDGNHYRRTGPEADTIYDLALSAKADPTDENIDSLKKALDPHSDAVEEGLMERDDLGNYTLPGIDIPVPKPMAKYIMELKRKEVPTGPMEKFWKQALMNPNSQARSDMFEYCQEYGITITENGYMVLYKAVNHNPASQMSDELVDKVGVEFLRLKRKGEIPSDYHVLEDETNGHHIVREDLVEDLTVVSKFPDRDITPIGENRDSFKEILEFAINFEIVVQYGNPGNKTLDLEAVGDHDDRRVEKNNILDNKVHYSVYNQIRELVNEFLTKRELYKDHGNLQEIYDQAKNSHDGQFEPSRIAKRKGGKYGMSINLGEPVPMPREKCDPSINESCSKGLHVGSHDYVSNFGQGKDTILACIVSPRDIVALPKRDNSKLRTCLYVPYAIMERDEDGDWEEIDDVTVDFEYMDEESDMDKLLKDLENSSSLTEVEKERKKIIESRLKEIE